MFRQRCARHAGVGTCGCAAKVRDRGCVAERNDAGVATRLLFTRSLVECGKPDVTRGIGKDATPLACAPVPPTTAVSPAGTAPAAPKPREPAASCIDMQRVPAPRPESAALRTLRAAFENLQVGALVHEMDGTSILCNPAAAAALGVSAADFVGRKASMDRWRCFHPDGTFWLPEDRPLWVTQRTRHAVHTAEIVWQKADDSFAWMSADTAVVDLGDGHEVIVTVFIDNTARVAMVDLFRAMYEDSPIGVIYMNSAGHITSVSRWVLALTSPT